MHASAAANGVVVSFPSKMLTHRKIAPATIKPKLAMMKSLFSTLNEQIHKIDKAPL